MADDSSPLARLERRPLSTYLAVGVGSALLAIAAIAVLGPSPRDSPSARPAGGSLPSNGDDTAPSEAGGGAGTDPSPDASPDATASGGADADRSDDAPADEATSEGDTNPTGGLDPQPFAESTDSDASNTPAEPTTTSTGNDAGQDTEHDLVIEDDPPDRPPPSPMQGSNQDAEADMTAEQMYEQGVQALEEKRYRDAYRLGTRSYYQRKSKDTLALKAKAACGLQDADSAKNALKQLPLGDDRRKEIRSFCRARGSRLGI